MAKASAWTPAGAAKVGRKLWSIIVAALAQRPELVADMVKVPPVVTGRRHHRGSQQPALHPVGSLVVRRRPLVAAPVLEYTRMRAASPVPRPSPGPVWGGSEAGERTTQSNPDLDECVPPTPREWPLPLAAAL